VGLSQNAGAVAAAERFPVGNRSLDALFAAAGSVGPLIDSLAAAIDPASPMRFATLRFPIQWGEHAFVIFIRPRM
jgi:hypothetical protein